MPSSYIAHGLHILSFLPLGQEDETGEYPRGPADVEMFRGHRLTPSGFELHQNLLEIGLHHTFLYWPNIGCFWIREGREVVVEPAWGVADYLLRPVLLGPVLAVLLLQRNHLVLHASAVALKNSDGAERAVAFLGNSGHGKSTMATALYKKGHRPLADDTIAVPHLTGDGVLPLIYPAVPHLKLRPPSVAALGENLASLARWSPDDDSYVVPLSKDFSLRPAALHALYCLEESSAIEVQALSPQEALMHLLRHSYRAGLFPDEEVGDDFLKCAELARQIPIFSLKRPKDFRLLPAVIERIEEHQKTF